MFVYVPKRKAFMEQQAIQQLEQQAIQDSLARLQPAEPPPTSAEPAEEQPALTRETEPTATPETLPLAETEGTQYVTVATPRLEATLSSAGGEIVSIRLLDFQTAKVPVQLIDWSPDSLSGLGKLTLWQREARVGLTGVHFDIFREGRTTPLTDGAVVEVGPDAGDMTLVLRAEGADGARVERYYTFYPEGYRIRAGVKLPAASFAGTRHVSWSFGPGMRSTEVNEKEDYAAFRVTAALGAERHKKKRGDFAETYSGVVDWVALQNKYFTTIMLTEEPVGGEVWVRGRKTVNYQSATMKLPLEETRGLLEGAVEIYAGPLDYAGLKAFGRGLEKNVDVGFDHFKIFKPVSIAVLWSMKMLYKVIPNYGIVIILLSVFTKVLFYRLTHKSFKSMRDMQALQPKLQALKEKYKDDRQKLSQETMKVYKESGVNPLGGCLPMVLQMPVFIALFSVLRSTIEVRNAPFFLWINDLSSQDVLFHLPFALPLLGSAVSVLPLLMGVGMLLQSKIGGGIAGPSSTTQPAGMTYILPVVFTFLFYKMPSGLVIYWLVNTVMSVAQQYYINKGADKDNEPPAQNADTNPTTEAANPKAKPSQESGKPARPPKRNRQAKSRAKKG